MTAESILSVRGRILPSTVGDVRLVATGASGRRYDGESAIGLSGERLEAVALEPADVVAHSESVDCLREADLVVLGPGSLYTSILPNLLIPGIRDALRSTEAPVVLVMNLMTQPGETDSMTALEHVEALERHAGTGLVDTVLLNARAPGAARLEPYARSGAELVRVDTQALRARGLHVLEEDLLADDDLLRHDPRALARTLLAHAGVTAAKGLR